MANPFAFRTASHPAIANTFPLSSDVYPNLYSFFFASQEFIRWYGAGCSWQLHCFGGPGSGKTTLCALVVQYLQTGVEETRVVSIFLQSDVLSNETAFLEDFLASIYHQIDGFGVVDYRVSELFEFYEDACQAGKRLALRIDLLRKALHARLAQVVRCFLVFDGVDRCSAALRLLLERELEELQLLGVKVVLSARLRPFEPPEEVKCDTDQTEEALNLFLECQNCKESVLCFPCRERGEVCPKCETAEYLTEPYQHVNIGIGQIPSSSMRDFIAWDLEKEHGELGFQSSCQEKPPLSSLGALLLRSRDGTAPQALLSRLLEQSHGNIGLAKLRLDNIHDALSIEDTEPTGDRLPPNIVLQFNAAIRHVGKQPAGQGELGLRVIASAAYEANGVPAADVERWLRTKSSDFPPRSLEDVLQAANGFLVRLNNDQQDICVYHPSFYMFVKEDYNASLLWARSQLHFDRAFRSLTSGQALMSDSKSKIPLVQSPTRMLSFDSSPRSEESERDSPSMFSRASTSMTSTSSYFGSRWANFH